MSEWIGGINDRRVLHIDTMKIYSCPEATAYALNFSGEAEYGHSIRINDIVVNCNHYIKSIHNGMKFEWYNQYLLDTGVSDFSTEPEYVSVEKPYSNYRKAADKRMGAKNFYRTVRKVYRAVKKAYLKDKDIVGTTFSIPRFIEMIGLSPNPAYTKHFKNHKQAYKDLFDLEFSTMYSANSGKEITAIRLNKFTNIGEGEDVDRDWDIIRYFSTHHDEESKYMNGRSDGIPIIRLEDNRIFASLVTASEITGVGKSMITWCCKGDIPYCKKWADRFTFRYVKFIDKES